MPPKNIQEIHFAKYVQDLYTEKQKTLMRKIKEGLNIWRDIQCS